MVPLLLLLTEQVSTPEMKVLNKTQENGTCILLLACTVKKGDHVAYRWSNEAGTHVLSPANSSHLLQVTLSNQHQDSIFNCTASNPVSSHSRPFNLKKECWQESSPGEHSGTSSIAHPMLTSPTALLQQPSLAHSIPHLLYIVKASRYIQQGRQLSMLGPGDTILHLIHSEGTNREGGGTQNLSQTQVSKDKTFSVPSALDPVFKDM